MIKNNFLQEFWNDESGLGTIELVLLVLVLAGLAIAFKSKISDFLDDLTDQFKAESFKVEYKK